MEKKNITILGAHGHIGRALFHSLRALEDYQVLGTSRGLSKDEGIIRFDPYTEDWARLGQTEILINCVGIFKESKKGDFNRIHIGLAELIIENRAKIGNPCIVQISALGASIKHPVRFLQTKGYADQRLLQYENTFIVRPSIVCVPGTMLARKLKRLQQITRLMNYRLFLPHGLMESRIQPVLMEDLAKIIAHLIVSRSSERVINVTGPEKVSYYYLLSILGGGPKKFIQVRTINEALCRGIVKYIVDPLFPDWLSYDQYKLLLSDNVADNTSAQIILGRPLHSTYEFWRNEKIL